MAYYQARTPQAKHIHTLMGELSTAQLQWETYADHLGKAYIDAYGFHAQALKDVEEKYRLAAESQYWVLSLLCVALAGGVAGGLMAPFVQKAGDRTGQQIARTIASETFQSVVGGVVQKKMEGIKEQVQPLKPAMRDPATYDKIIKIEIGTCFSIARDEVEEAEKRIDNDSWGNATDTSAIIKRIMDYPLLRDMPKTKDMPNIDKVAREAELGMWVAWATQRDIDYWKTKMKHAKGDLLSKKGLAMDELRHYRAVVERLKILGAAGAGTTEVKQTGYGNRKEILLDIPKLRTIGAFAAMLPGASDFLGQVGAVTKEKHKVLTQMEHLPPVYKRS